MNPITDREGRNVPFFVDYFLYKSVATEDFSPTEDPSLSAVEIGLYVEKGFIVRPDADGDVYGITLYAYLRNNKSLTGLIPQKFLGSQNQWVECRFIKIYPSNDTNYKTTATAINVGITI
jgi:hypothetical protein